MKTIYVIKVNFDDKFVGYIEKKEDFKKWLKKHNLSRDEDEFSYDFDLIEISEWEE